MISMLYIVGRRLLLCISYGFLSSCMHVILVMPSFDIYDIVVIMLLISFDKEMLRPFIEQLLIGLFNGMLEHFSLLLFSHRDTIHLMI